MFSESEESSLGYYIRNIFHGLYYMTDEKLKSLGLTNQQGHVLNIIYDNCQKGHKVSRRALEEFMHLRGPSITHLLCGLEEKGYIQRSMSDSDRRSIIIAVTPKGEKLVHEIRQIFLESEFVLQTGMTPEELETLKQLLMKMFFNLSKHD